MEVFKVAPFDQILFLNGEYLNDNTQSLGSLGVLPGSSIFLKVNKKKNKSSVKNDKALVFVSKYIVIDLSILMQIEHFFLIKGRAVKM